MSRRTYPLAGNDGTWFRVVYVYTAPDGKEQRRYLGPYDAPAPARSEVTRRLRQWAEHLTDVPEETVTFDAWVEPVTVTNHPGVRYTDDWTPPAEGVERRARDRAIASVADALTDDVPGCCYPLVDAIRRLARGTALVSDVRDELGEGWEDL